MAFLVANALVWDGESDDRYPAEVLIERNRITAVARGHGQIQRDGVEVIDGAGTTLMPCSPWQPAHTPMAPLPARCKPVTGKIFIPRKLTASPALNQSRKSLPHPARKPSRYAFTSAPKITMS